jgi:hypothetical protein
MHPLATDGVHQRGAMRFQIQKVLETITPGYGRGGNGLSLTIADIVLVKCRHDDARPMPRREGDRILATTLTRSRPVRNQR